MQERETERDETLVKSAQAGDSAATELLLRRYMNAVRARARGFFLAGGETDDLVQEGMIGLYSAIGDYDEREGKSFKNFAYLCVTRHILDAVKRSARQKNIPLNNYISLFDPDFSAFAGDSPEEALLNREEASEFRLKLMRTLSDFEFRVVTMYLEGMSYARICEELKKNSKSIDNALVRAKRKLFKIYQVGGEN